MFKKENLFELQELLKTKNIDAYLIFTSDPHDNEYVGDYYLALRKYFCPFSGSAGELLLLKDKAFYFADGRYWIQAAKELENSGINLIKLGDKDAPSLIEMIKNLDIKTLGLDFNLITENEFKTLKTNNINLINLDVSNLIVNRPNLSKSKVFELDKSLNTLTRNEKLENIIKEMHKKGAEANLVTTLDDIAWILNLRGSDIKNNPVFYSYLYISKNYGTHLFIDIDKLDIKLEGIIIHDYLDIFKFLNSHNEVKTLVDPFRVNANLFSLLKNPILGKNPSYLFKAIKGEKEIENIIKVQEIDGIALLKFKKYLLEHLNDGLNEYDYAKKLEEFRFSNSLCFDLSFNTIAAVGKNAALMHYAPNKLNSSVVSKNEIEFLVDSGGQYYGGTTDTTRTFLVGNPTNEYKKDYTLTLKALINLSNAIFIKGSDGHTLDIKARQFMWENGLDYKCGTGHGVGYILNVHEGPNGFRYKKVPGIDDQDPIVPGMITTVEPGVYKENKYGIRIENNLLCVKAFETSDGEFYKFQTITYVPIDKEAIEINLLTQEEKNWLNNYHKEVYERLSKYILDKDLLEFLKEETSPI